MGRDQKEQLWARPHFLSALRNCITGSLKKCAACKSPALGPVLHTNIGADHHTAKWPGLGKKSPAGGKKNCPAFCLFVCLLVLLVKKYYLSSKYNLQRKKEPGVPGWTHLKAEHIQQLHKPCLLSLCTFHPLPAGTGSLPVS